MQQIVVHNNVEKIEKNHREHLSAHIEKIKQREQVADTRVRRRRAKRRATKEALAAKKAMVKKDTHQWKIPSEEDNGPVKCRGVRGTDQAALECQTFYDNSSILITDAVTSKEVAPVQVELLLESLMNPDTNVVTESFKVETRTFDGYPMDVLDSNAEVNFFCIFPCRSCQEETPSVCESCYTATTDFIYLWDESCIE